MEAARRAVQKGVARPVDSMSGDSRRPGRPAWAGDAKAVSLLCEVAISRSGHQPLTARDSEACLPSKAGFPRAANPDRPEATVALPLAKNVSAGNEAAPQAASSCSLFQVVRPNSLGVDSGAGNRECGRRRPAPQAMDAERSALSLANDLEVMRCQPERGPQMDALSESADFSVVGADPGLGCALGIRASKAQPDFAAGGADAKCPSAEQRRPRTGHEQTCVAAAQHLFDHLF